MRLRVLLVCALGAASCRTADVAGPVRAPEELAESDSIQPPAPPTRAEGPQPVAGDVGALEAAAATKAPAPSVSAPAGAQDPDVRRLLDDYYRDYASGDGSALAQHFWPDATLATIRSRALGEGSSVVVMRVEDYVRQHMGAGARETPLRIELETPDIQTTGSVASVVAHYRAVDPSGHEAQSWQGADVFSLVRHEGQWRIASLVFEGARFGR